MPSTVCIHEVLYVCEYKGTGIENVYTALLLDFIKTWDLKSLESEYTWVCVFFSAGENIKHTQSQRESYADKWRRQGYRSICHSQKERKRQREKENVTCKDREWNKELGKEAERAPAARDRPTLTVGHELGSHSHSCHMLKWNVGQCFDGISDW